MRATLDAHILAAPRPAAPSSGRTSSGANFRQILQQQPFNWGASYQPLTQPAPTSVPSTAFSNLGSTPNSPDPTGGQTYDPLSNPLLTPQVSSTDLNGTLVTQKTSPTATLSAAQQFAQVLGGTVVQLQAPWSNTAPVYGIEMPGGQMIDATTIANILGNNAAYPGAAVKSGEIAKLLGVQYSPGMANLATQLAAARVQS